MVQGAVAALTFEDVTFAYPRAEPILHGVSLAVPRGKVTVLLGPNGCGKTTLLRLAAGLTCPARGAVRLADGTQSHLASREGRVGYIPQQLGLVRNATALENTLHGALHHVPSYRSFLNLYPSDVEDAALAALDAVGLRKKADLKVHRLSGGERQRVAIARTLVQRPDVIIADEILASLDVVQAHGVLELQREWCKRGITVLMSLHQVDLALTHADGIVFLHQGRITPPRPPAGMTAEEARCALYA